MASISECMIGLVLILFLLEFTKKLLSIVYWFIIFEYIFHFVKQKQKWKWNLRTVFFLSFSSAFLQISDKVSRYIEAKIISFSKMYNIKCEFRKKSSLKPHKWHILKNILTSEIYQMRGWGVTCYILSPAE